MFPKADSAAVTQCLVSQMCLLVVFSTINIDACLICNGCNVGTVCRPDRMYENSHIGHPN